MKITTFGCNQNRERVDFPVRYSLVVSLATAEESIDLYTPVANLLKIPTPISIE